MQKYLYTLKIILLSIVLISFSEGSEQAFNKRVNISGKVASGYLKGSTVYVDLNHNKIFDMEEPVTKTSKDGAFSLSINSSELETNPSIIAYGGIDSSTGEAFFGELSSIIENKENLNVNITAITTLINEMLKNENVNESSVFEIKQKVAIALNLKIEDLIKDPIKEFSNSSEIYKQNLMIIKIIEFINGREEKNQDNFKKALEVLSNAIKEETKLKNISELLIDGGFVNVQNELDLIDGEIDKIRIIPTLGEGYGEILNRVYDREKIKQLANKSNQEKVNLANGIIDENAIKGTNSSLKAVIKDLSLNINPYRTRVEWSSSDTNYLTNDGKIIRANIDSNSVKVNLTAIISKGEDDEKVSIRKSFDITILPLEIEEKETNFYSSFSLEMKDSLLDSDAVTRASEDLDISDILSSNSSAQNIVSNLYFPQQGLHSTNISWTTSNTTIISNTGIVIRPNSDIGDKKIILKAIISKGSESLEKEFEVTVKATLDEEILNKIASKLTFEKIKNQNQSLDYITSDLNLFETLEEASIIWSSSYDEFIDVSTGRVTRPDIAIGQSDTSVDLTATISYKSASKDIVFNLFIKAIDSSIEKSVDMDLQELNFDTIKGNNTNEGKIASDLSLPTKGTYDTVISWESSKSDFISNEGRVKRANFEDGNQSVLLRATISKGEIRKSKEFNLIVLSLFQIDSNLDFSQNTNVSKIFRSNGLEYSLELYSNLVRDENLISNNLNSLKANVRVNSKDIETLIFPIEYSNQEIKLKIFSNNRVLKFEKNFILNQSLITLDEIKFEDTNSLKLPSFTKQNALVPPMVSDF